MIRSKRKKPRPERMQGDELGELRTQCLDRDGNCCVVCLVAVSDDLPDWHDRKAHMAHIKAKRIGKDTLANVRTLCGLHHRLEHAYGKDFQKPCKPKR